MTQTFEQWMELVDAQVQKRTDYSVYDLVDCPFIEWYEDWMTPSKAARAAIRRDSGEDD